MAANAAVSALLKPTSEHGRNVFPLDTKQVYSQKAGQIVPVKAFHFMPNDYFDIKASDFTLTFPMQTAPFLRGRKEFSFYSVYYNAIWSLYNQYQGQKHDPKTSAFGIEPKLVEPRVRLFDLYTRCYMQWLVYIAYEHIIPAFNDQEDINYTRERFLDDYYVDHVGGFTVSVQNEGSDTFILGYSQADWTRKFDGIPYGILFAPDYDEPNLSALSVAQFCLDIVGHHRAYNSLRKLDMLGYGNLYPIFSDAERKIIDIISKHSDGSQWNEQQFQYITNITKELLERLVYMTWNHVNTPSTRSAKMVNLYPICAYNLIFYHFFRNSYYDLHYNPQDYNLDFISIRESQQNFISFDNFSLRFLDIEYHQWKKDTFTAVLPDTQFGAVASIDLSFSGRVPISGTGTISGSTGEDYQRWTAHYSGQTLSPVTTLTTNGNGTGVDVNSIVAVHTHPVSGSVNISSSANASFTSAFDVISLKRAEMLQEYRQQLMRAGNRTSDVFRALYGTPASSEHEDDIIPRFLETFGEDIFVDPVTATANTGGDNLNGQLGDLASRAKLSGSSNHIKFNAGGNFGVILCLSYVVPTSEYNSYMIDPHIKELTPQAHFIPQFDKYGLEPVYSDELNCLLPLEFLQVLGYAPAYHYKKSAFDQVHGAFCSYAIPPRRLSADTSFARINYLGEFNNWVSPRTDMQGREITLIRDFYINPSVLDNVFVRAAGADQADDQFICNTYFEVKSTRAMSKVGLIDFV